MHFGHVLTAMVTPFDKNNEVDYDVMTILIEHLLANGTEGLVITGTTGESATLSEVEMKRIYEHVVHVVHKRVPVLAGTGTNNTKETIALTQIAEASQVDGIMLVSPYYNRPSQAGLYAHFKAVALATSLPIMLYNIPTRCSVHIQAETIIKLSEIDNILALKEASGDLDHTGMVIANCKAPFHVYSGDDSMTLPILSIGGVGVVSVASHIIGKEINELTHTFLAGNVERASFLHRKYLPTMQALFLAPSPAPTKYALGQLGIDVGPVRLPLVDLTEAEQQIVDQYIVNPSP